MVSLPVELGERAEVGVDGGEVAAEVGEAGGDPLDGRADAGGEAALEVGDQRAADLWRDALEAALPAPLAAVRAPQPGRVDGGAEGGRGSPGWR
jgi:hypothetical protein